MDYMDQSIPCLKCGKEHSQFSTRICYDCERTEREAKRKAEWNAKSDVEKAIAYLESWSNPTHYTFDRDNAAFILKVVKELAAQPKMVVGVLATDRGAHVAIHQQVGDVTYAIYGEFHPIGETMGLVVAKG